MEHQHDAVYMAHGYCLLWKPWLVGLHVGADVLIVISYVAIPIGILLFLNQRKFSTPALNHLGYWAAAFILLCGITHFFNIITLWKPIYEVTGAIKALSGVVSIITAVLIFPLIPKAVAIPTVQEYEDVLDKLEKKSDEQEKKIAESTAHFRNMMYETNHRSKNLLSVIMGISSMTAKKGQTIESYVEELHGRLQCMSIYCDMLLANEWKKCSMREIIQQQLNAFTILQNAQIEGPDVMFNPSQAQYMCLAVYELATNSMKHELKVGVGSRYTLKWNVTNGKFKFLWHEENSRPIEGPTRQGFGHRLLTKIVPEAFKGRADLTFGRHSVNYILEAKL